MVTVGAVLKKIAIGLLSHPKSWKVIGGIVLGLIVIIVESYWRNCSRIDCYFCHTAGNDYRSL